MGRDSCEGHTSRQLGRQAVRVLSRFPAALAKAFQGIDNCERHPIFARYGITPRTELVFDSFHIAARRIRETRSWGFFPDWVASALPGLAPIIPRGWNPRYDVSVVWPKHRVPTRPLKGLATEIKRRLAGA